MADTPPTTTPPPGSPTTTTKAPTATGSGGRYVVNVQSWGSQPMLRQGEIVPEDCTYDLEKALARKRIVTEEEYRKYHPDWDPEKQERESAAQARGRDVPTAADLPDEEEMARQEAEAVAPPEDIVIAVQQPSNPEAPAGSSSTTTTRRTSSTSTSGSS